MSGITWLASYPKSGNTWLRVFLANLRAGPGASADINALQTAQFAARELLDRTIGWETAELTGAELGGLRLRAQEALARETPEFPIKTHEVFAHPHDGGLLFSPQATRAALYVVRNPLDVAVSLSHYWGRDIDATIAFMNDPHAELTFEPNATQITQLLCDWSTHVRSWIDASRIPVCVLRYEDMLAAPEATFGRAAQAAGGPTDPARITQAVECSRFDRLRQQEAENGFIERTAGRVFFREGRSGGWREKLTARQVAAITERHGAMMRRLGYLDAGETPGQVRN